MLQTGRRSARPESAAGSPRRFHPRRSSLPAGAASGVASAGAATVGAIGADAAAAAAATPGVLHSPCPAWFAMLPATLLAAHVLIAGVPLTVHAENTDCPSDNGPNRLGLIKGAPPGAGVLLRRGHAPAGIGPNLQFRDTSCCCHHLTDVPHLRSGPRAVPRQAWLPVRPAPSCRPFSPCCRRRSSLSAAFTTQTVLLCSAALLIAPPHHCASASAGAGAAASASAAAAGAAAAAGVLHCPYPV